MLSHRRIQEKPELSAFANAGLSAQQARQRHLSGGLLMVVTCACAALGQQSPSPGPGQGLEVSFGADGLERLTYRGHVLEDTGQYPADALHIWHMKLTDRSGKVLTTGQYGWGENNNGRTWDEASHTWTYNFQWGSIKAQYEQHADALEIRVTTSNRADSGVVFDGATIYPLALHLAKEPAGFAGGPQLADNMSAPSVTLADYGAGEVAAVVAEAAGPLYSGFQPASGAVWSPVLSGTSPDALAAFAPHYDRMLAPGHTESYTLSLRFAPPGRTVSVVAPDALRAFSVRFPQVLDWKDRRVIGTVYLASSPQGDKTLAGGYGNNPRRYFNDGNPGDFDVRESAGLAKFQERVLSQAREVAANLKRMDAQGVITWDIEGEQFPQDTSYVCSPDKIAQAAPEMETTVQDPNSPYSGMKLDDAYFKMIRDAGFKIGVCVRPQRFTLGADGRARQVTLADEQVVAELTRKMRFAHDRWGATLFYIDSTVHEDGGTLDAGLLEQAAKAFPDSLVIPEESTARMYRATAPFQSFLFHGELGTAPIVQTLYPRAFSVNLVNDVDAKKLADHRLELTDAVRRGDVLMIHADTWQANNPVVVEIYRAASRHKDVSQ